MWIYCGWKYWWRLTVAATVLMKMMMMTVAEGVMAMAIAMLDGRDHVLPGDLQRCAVDVMAHRVVVSGQRSGGAYVDFMVRQVPAPR